MEHQRELEEVSARVFTRRQALFMGGGALLGVAMNKHVQDWTKPEYDITHRDPVEPTFDLDVIPIEYSFDLISAQNIFDSYEVGGIDIWSETPGIAKTSTGLLLEPLDMKIINKRGGDEYIDNPPINACGGYIRTNGDFSVETTTTSAGPVHVQLYGSMPKVMDDNRYEQARLDCEISDDTLRVRRWSGGLFGIATKEFRLPRVSGEHKLRVDRVGNKLQFLVDGYEVGDMEEDDIFAEGTIWFGLNATESYASVSQMTFREAGTRGQESGFWRTGNMHVNPSKGDTLQGLMDGRGFPLMMGSAVSLYPLMADKQYAQTMLGGNYKILTIENAMKELYLMSLNGTWEPKHALSLIRVIRDHGILVNGHTAIYDKAMHKSISEMPYDTHDEKMRIAKYIEDYVVRFGETFGQYLYSCDVVNEALDGYGPSYIPGGVHLRHNVFSKALGRDWLTIAFKAAAGTMPKTKLGINENGVEVDPWFRGNELFGLADYVRAQGGRVDYVAFQMHVYFAASFVKRAMYRQLLAEGRRRNYTTRTSEMDVTDVRGEIAQAQQNVLVLEENMRDSNVDAHITWGSDDKNGSTGGRGPGSSLPLDDKYREKLSMRMMKNTIRTFDPSSQ